MIILLSIAMAIAIFREENPFEAQDKGAGENEMEIFEY